MTSLLTFLQQTKKELGHVTWLNSRQVVLFSIAVVTLSIVSAYMLGAFDFVLQLGLTKLLTK